MYSALYYPHTRTEDKNLLKTSLFLWDNLEFIVPYDEYGFHSNDAEVAEALEVIAKPLIPSLQDRRIVHEEILDLVESSIPERLNFQLTDNDSKYLIYPQKFHFSTWQVLEESNLAKQYRDFGEFENFALQSGLGLYLMAILAITCAKNKKRLITDKIDAYKALYKSISDVGKESVQEDSALAKLMVVRFKGFNFENFSLRELIDLRKNEGDLLKDLRRLYLTKVDICSKEISESADNLRVIQEITDSFTEDMESDMRELKRALQINAAQSILSKEFGVAVLALALQQFEPISSTVLSVGALTKNLVDYNDKRRKILKDHASAWLYSAKSRFTLY